MGFLRWKKAEARIPLKTGIDSFGVYHASKHNMYLYGLTFGMDINKSERNRRDSDSLNKEIAEYKTALDLFKTISTKPAESDLRDWIRECEEAIRDRLLRVEQISEPFYSNIVRHVKRNRSITNRGKQAQ